MKKKLIHSLWNKEKRLSRHDEQRNVFRRKTYQKKFSENRNMQLHKRQENNKTVSFSWSITDAGILNPWIWMANHTLVDSSAVCNAVHSPEFLCPLTITDESKSCTIFANAFTLWKICSWHRESKFYYPEEEVFNQTMWTIHDCIKHPILLSCFFYPMLNEEFQKKKCACYLLV